MATSDKALGGLMLLIAASVFVYYTLWALILPFFDEADAIQSFFPPREWAVRLPAFILAVGLGVVGAFVGLTLVKEKRRKVQATRLRTA